ncbi:MULTISPECIES: (Fe-S)-binding protein [Rhodomicrobium]|uniref:(Fe-S)-binding protein n=1 Tax=Rhodomicrobium TaxID=1068 RepID=UPI000B4B302D|nr:MULTISPECIES: (Fe-S)-binding protein [Rhodomicrobium]
MSTQTRPLRVGLFVTCLVDLFRPSVGFAAVKLLEGAGCVVEVPEAQVCCGQPAYNSGDRADAKAIARQIIEAFQGFDYIVAPSGSCAGMLRKHYPMLFEDDPEMLPRAKDFAARSFELVSFLTGVLRVSAVHAEFDGTVTYHDSCSNLREMGVARQPRALLETVKGLTLIEAEDREVCCGFGGTFSIKFPDISNAMVSAKTAALSATEAETVLGGDLGCLMNIAGKLSREGSPVRVRHVAEVLAGETGAPPIAAKA